jgi:FkbM family methyltransferase
VNSTRKTDELPPGEDTRFPERRRIARGPVTFEVQINDAGEDRFWQKFETGRWERETLDVLDTYLGPETVFVDIGSWIGPTTLYAAALGCRVFCVEADPEALARLRANLELNPRLADRIEIVDRALFPSPGEVRLASLRKPGDSMSSIVHDVGAAVWSVRTITPGELAERIAGAGRYFLKIDIEGGEYASVPRAAALLRLPVAAVHLSFHPEFALGRSRGLRRLQRLIRLSWDTAGIFRVLGGMRAARMTAAGSFRSPAIDALGRFGLCLWPVGGSWLFLPRR